MQNNTLSRPDFSLSGTALKRIACLSMLLDHIGASCIEAGILLDRYELVSLTCGNLSVRMPTGEDSRYAVRHDVREDGRG